MTVKKLDQSIDLGLVAGYLYDHTVGSHIDDITSEDSRKRNDLFSFAGCGPYLYKAQLSVNGRIVRKLFYISYILQFCNLLLNLVDYLFISAGYNCDPGIPGISGNTCSDALNIVDSPGKESGNSAENTGVIISQKLKNYFLHKNHLYTKIRNFLILYRFNILMSIVKCNVFTLILFVFGTFCKS